MARTTGPRVEFAQAVRSIRPPRDDELSVMRYFSKHAYECHRCRDPYQTWKESGELCDKGHSLARDVARYIYSKGARPFSIIDKDSNGERTEIEVPVDCHPVRDLVKAFDRGMSLRSRSSRAPAIISQDRNYHVQERTRPREERRYYDRDGRANVIEIAPSRSERRERDRHSRDERDRRHGSTKYTVDGKGSLYPRDEEAKRQRKRYDEQPVIIYAEPRSYRR